MSGRIFQNVVLQLKENTDILDTFKKILSILKEQDLISNILFT